MGTGVEQSEEEYARWGRYVDRFNRYYAFYNLRVANLAEAVAVEESIQESQTCSHNSKRYTILLQSTFRGDGIELVWMEPAHGAILVEGGLPMVSALIPNDTVLKDAEIELSFRFRMSDYANCNHEHSTHKDGSAEHSHIIHRHHYTDGDWSDWTHVADLFVDGAEVPDVPVEEPEASEEPEAPADQSAELARLRAELDDLRGDLSAVRDSIAWLLENPLTGDTVTLADTVEIVHHDTLLYCPPTDEDRRDLFDLFTGVDDDSSNAEGAAGKVSAVRVEAWGAIKALIQEE